MKGDLHADLRDLGFVVVPLLEPDQVERLRADFVACHPVVGGGFETDFERDDGDFKEGVADRTAWVWDGVSEILPGYEPFMASYLVKWATPDSDLALHADWSYVDESVLPTYAVWVPLVDTGPGIDNGPLAVVPRSHRLVRSWRGTATPAWYEPGQEGFVASAVTVDAPAGHAVVFDNRLLHHSPPNLSQTPRPVLAGAFAPKGAQLLHVLGDGTGRGRILEVDASFFRDHNPSGLRQDRPEVPPDAPEVELIQGTYDPVELASDHGLDDAAAFRRGDDAKRRLRWPRPSGPLSLARPQSALEEVLDLAALPWAPSMVGADVGAAIHLSIVVESMPTPVGASLLGPLVDSDPPWESLRLVRVRSGDEVEIDGGPAAAGSEVAVIGLAPEDLPLLLKGQGWASLAAGGSIVVPEPCFRARNRGGHDVALLIARPQLPGRRRGLRSWRTRVGPPPEAWRLAVELTEAVS